MSNPTPWHRMCDREGQPYFLWDSDMTLERFRELLADPDPEVRAYYIGKLMRQARPDDVFLFVRPADVRASWEQVLPYLGDKRDFWIWIFARWEALPGGWNQA